MPDAEYTLRSPLFLDRTNTDYYLKTYLSVINAYPDWKQQFGYNLQESYAVEELIPRGVYIQGADMPGNPNSPGLFTDPDTNALPVELHYRIIYLADNLCQISGLETAVQYNSTVTTVGNDPNKILRITWPDAIPFAGPLQLTQPWMLGAAIDIFVQPSYFPFAQLIASVQGNAYLQALLSAYDISAEFNEDKDPMEQTAMALTVLGLNNWARINAGQSSLQVPVNSSTAGWLETGYN